MLPRAVSGGSGGRRDAWTWMGLARVSIWHRQCRAHTGEAMVRLDRSGVPWLHGITPATASPLATLTPSTTAAPGAAVLASNSLLPSKQNDDLGDYANPGCGDFHSHSDTWLVNDSECRCGVVQCGGGARGTSCAADVFQPPTPTPLTCANAGMDVCALCSIFVVCAGRVTSPRRSRPPATALPSARLGWFAQRLCSALRRCSLVLLLFVQLSRACARRHAQSAADLLQRALPDQDWSVPTPQSHLHKNTAHLPPLPPPSLSSVRL